MNNLKNLTDLEKRKWLINEMKTKWFLNEKDINDDDCSDDAIVCGNSGMRFGDIFNLCRQLDWTGFEFGNMEIFIDTFANREPPNLSFEMPKEDRYKHFRPTKSLQNMFVKEWHKKACSLPTPDEFHIYCGIIRIWYD
jgi:hypothetical protein